MRSKGWTFVHQENICKISKPITVFLRNPRDRFISGVNTFLQHLSTKEVNIDQHTALYFINQYLFLNRHYAPQFFWLLNLSRFVGIHHEILLCDIKDISKLTNLHDDAEVLPVTSDLVKVIKSYDWQKLELYLYLDQILLNHIGQTVTVSYLLNYLKIYHDELYNLVFSKTFNIINVLSKT